MVLLDLRVFRVDVVGGFVFFILGIVLRWRWGLGYYWLRERDKENFNYKV